MMPPNLVIHVQKEQWPHNRALRHAVLIPIQPHLLTHIVINHYDRKRTSQRALPSTQRPSCKFNWII